MSLEDWNYYNDHRVRNAGKDQPPTITVWDDEDNELIIELAWRYEVCPTCEGRGTHVNPSIDSGGLTREDFDADPDFHDSYMSGMYDVTCYQCGGKRVVPSVDWDKLSPEHAELYEKHLREEEAYAREVAWERRMGC